MQIGNRTQTLLLVLILVVGVALVAMLATGARGGPLDPPGSPASTDGVRQAGTPISSLPFTISQPGSYYVTRDLTGLSGQNGITISQSNVTLDLNGFTLHGVSQTADGIFISGAPSAITIQNGIVRGWYNGIDAQLGSYVTISGIAAIQNGGSSNDGSYGVILANNSVLENCNISGGAATGLLARSSTVRDCLISNNGNDGMLVTNSAFVQRTRLRGNNVVAGGWYDTHWVGTNNVFDSVVGRIVFDVSMTNSTGSFARSYDCAEIIFGLGFDGTTRVDIVGGPC